jgi:hypothetical protein
MKYLALAIILASSSTQAQVYQWRDKNGDMHFSDTAPKDQPDLMPKNIVMNSALPAQKIPKKAPERTGPNVIYIDDSNSNSNIESGCSTKKLGYIGENSSHESPLDLMTWKNCRDAMRR